MSDEPSTPPTAQGATPQEPKETSGQPAPPPAAFGTESIELDDRPIKVITLDDN